MQPLYLQLHSYIRNVSEYIKSPLDIKWLMLGLAAASIEDLRLDFRESFSALGKLYLAAAQAGIAPKTYFAEVSEISSAEKGGDNGSSMKDFLQNFDKSAYFRECIKPKLP